MANVAAGTVWNLPNYTGELFTADAINTPFLSMIGGLTGGMMTENFEFPVDSLYSHQSASQPAITETASLTAPTAISYVKTQDKNVTQIFQEQVSLSYVKISNAGRLSGINTAGASNNAPSERDFQIARALEKIARDVNYTFLNGTYQIATNAGVANKTRGMIELCSTGNTVDAASAELTKALIDSLLLEMHTNGAYFKNMVLFCNGYQKQRISNAYGYAPSDRSIGGLNIKQIETDFGNIGVQLDRFMPAGTIGIFDMSVIAPVFQPVPNKGNLFYEELAKTGAAESGQIFGQIGLAHGASFMHGTITNLKV
ncbi:SU10 major capsid protein [Pseudobacteroides cellulosolvens]|uniref:Major capsid protein n=1 Tax=Pseudobacteroides cellulosolvens ATCC 35603 = DSM 2933 TaxID=398512 RepID=A0A0L6JH09_9FIRM|nr:DUF5309 family protein [Pseudobacteroides cellulosolvens]KNY24995.1 hypothetical protein Bccel_0252 [Pseudobacteroides cellulosolvens ATCC 35603 = DSM 2933]